MTEVHDDIQDQGAPQPEQEINPSLDPNQPFNLAGKFFLVNNYLISLESASVN